MMDEFMEFFQICHSTDQPVCEQCKHRGEKRKCKEANQEKDVIDKKCAATC